MSQVSEDLDQILAGTEEPLRAVTNQSVLLTGGTGFVGTWLTKSWSRAARRWAGRGRLVILSRDPEEFLRQRGPLADQVTFIQGDIRRFSLVGLGHFDLIVHAATPARATLNNNSPKEMLSIIIDGQRNLIEQAAHSRCPRILFTSSGAVYGPQPADVTRLEESQLLGPDPMNPLTAYHEGKRMSELLLAIATREGVLEAVTARLFAFVGPYLPLNEHFAIGNFIRDGLSGGPIIIKGDGRTVRSYQYPTDMVSWLWTLATRGQPGRAYNVGSDHALSMREIAQQVSGATDGAEVHILGKIDPGVPVDRYVPSIERSKGELELSNKIDFQEAVRRTVAWHRRPTP